MDIITKTVNCLFVCLFVYYFAFQSHKSIAYVLFATPNKYQSISYLLNLELVLDLFIKMMVYDNK